MKWPVQSNFVKWKRYWAQSKSYKNVNVNLVEQLVVGQGESTVGQGECGLVWAKVSLLWAKVKVVVSGWLADG